MNSRFLSISLSVAAVVAMASADVLAQGRGGGAGGGSMGGGTGQGGGMQGGGAQSGTQRGAESAPAERPAGAQDRGRSASAEQRQAPAAEQVQGKTPQDQLTQNPRLADNVAKLLPAGTNVQAAVSGFKNLGEFVAAAHVSSNLGIPFSDLKTRLLAGDSLGTAIQALKPGVDAQLEVSRARARADELARG